MKYSICLAMALCLSACKPERQEIQVVQQKITPNIAEQVNLSYITAGLKNKGFACSSFENASNKPMLLCSRIQGQEIDACSDSIWIEHDGQNHIISNQQFYECDNERKMVITRKPN